MSEGKVALLRAVLLFVVCALAAPALAAGGVDAELRDFIKDYYKGETITVALGNLPPQLKGNVHAKRIVFVKLPDANGTGICAVTTQARNGAESRSQVSFRVQARKMLYVLESSLKKGEAVGRDDVVAREAFLNGSGAAYPSTPEDVFGKVARKDIRAGEVLTNAVLEEPVTIRRGQIVAIKAQNKRMVVETKGVALEKGRVGDVVRAKASSGKEITGKVAAGNTILVEF
jgi:flagella basal body P-ring formation protein FlgA